MEPAIFGTLLERALDAAERHALGAHYTPRAYVERLVLPTLVEPLRDDWRSSQAVITELVNAGDREAAIETARHFTANFAPPASSIPRAAPETSSMSLWNT